MMMTIHLKVEADEVGEQAFKSNLYPILCATNATWGRGVKVGHHSATTS